MCLKNNFRLTKFDEWTDFAEFKSYLPLLRQSAHEELLTDRSVRQIHHDRSYYCFRVTDALKAGDTMPLFMARENIVRILTKRRQEEVIRREEERMVGNAEQNGLIKRYTAEPDEPLSESDSVKVGSAQQPTTK